MSQKNFQAPDFISTGVSSERDQLGVENLRRDRRTSGRASLEETEVDPRVSDFRTGGV